MSIKDLSISFFSNKKETKIIHSISYNLNRNEILGIVGESGSGKSVSSLAVLGLLPKKISKITSGSIIFENEDPPADIGESTNFIRFTGANHGRRGFIPSA